MKTLQRIHLDENFGKRPPMTTASKWQRTDWNVSAAIGVGIGSAVVATTCFYFLFDLLM